MEEELDRVRVVGDDGSWLVAIELRLLDHVTTKRGVRRRIGRRVWRLASGEALDIIDKDLFIVSTSGEMLRRF